MSTPVTFSIDLSLRGSLARAGVIHTPHGDIPTPAFVTVGTKATVKGISPDDLQQKIRTPVVLANTYHLFLQPGHEIISASGGLHKFANWNMPTMTDSGGFQVFSLGAAFGKGVSKFAKTNAVEVSSDQGINVYSVETATEHGKLCLIDEDGVTFTSHLDGSMHRFTAERSIEIQHAIGADIIVAFDECTSPTADYIYQAEAMERTHRWAKRSILAHKQNYKSLKTQGLYGVVQGGKFLDLRERSAQVLGDMDFSGFGIGGSFSKSDLGEALEVVNKTLPKNKPRHLLGIGEPEDIIEGVLLGCDTFDCVAPTRIARNGTIYVHTGVYKTTKCCRFTYPELQKVNLRHSKYQYDSTVLDPGAPADSVGQMYTKAYVAHLFRSSEMLGPQLASIHNLQTIVAFTSDLRNQILGIENHTLC